MSTDVLRSGATLMLLVSGHLEVVQVETTHRERTARGSSRRGHKVHLTLITFHGRRSDTQRQQTERNDKNCYETSAYLGRKSGTRRQPTSCLGGWCARLLSESASSTNCQGFISPCHGITFFERKTFSLTWAFSTIVQHLSLIHI